VPQVLLAHTSSQCQRAYILPLWFFSFFLFVSTSNLRGHWTDLNQTWTHIHLWPLFKKFGQNSCTQAFTRMVWGAKTAFLDRLWTLTEHNLCNVTWYRQSERKSSIYGDSSTYLKFGEIWSTNGCEWLASIYPSLPPKFSHWETLPALPHVRYITDSRQTLARVT